MLFKGRRELRVFGRFKRRFHPSISPVNAIGRKITVDLGLQCIHLHLRMHQPHGGFTSRHGLGRIDQCIVQIGGVVITDIDGSDNGFDLRCIERSCGGIAAMNGGHAGRQCVVNVKFADVFEGQFRHCSRGTAQPDRRSGTRKAVDCRVGGGGPSCRRNNRPGPSLGRGDGDQDRVGINVEPIVGLDMLLQLFTRIAQQEGLVPKLFG